MPPTDSRSTYHHGALREELITACLALIESEGIGAVSLRRVAREAGVSPGAPYHHFPDRASLLNAITARGYQLLLAEVRRAVDAAGSPVQALGALIETYVRFARANTAYVRLMYRPELSESDKDPAAEATAEEGLQLLTETVVACQRAGAAPPGDPGPLVTMIWSVAAGLAMLSVEGPLDHLTAARGSTVPELTAQVSALVQTLLTGATPPR
ncbi:TetR/AcrR family transcriptional regulator [Dactylosporangium sp. CA-092794]|uniref:TetR/AcrR family transcriptional regulator n=1 Tax=Dactylosporangium sp. CA-092794 TaxID=3239929 RepID=UPI003D8D76FA